MIGSLRREAVAQAAGISPSTLSSYLNGRSFAGEANLAAIARALGRSEVELWRIVHRHHIDILEEITAAETREGPADSYEISTSGGVHRAAPRNEAAALIASTPLGLETPLRQLVRSVASEVLEELEAQGRLPKRPGD